MTTSTTSTSFPEHIESGRSWAIAQLEAFDRQVTTVTRKKLGGYSPRVANWTARIGRGIFVTLFMYACNKTVIIPVALTFTAIAFFERGRLVNTGKFVFSGVSLYAGLHATAALVDAVSTEYLFTNLLTAAVYGAISYHMMNQAIYCERIPRGPTPPATPQNTPFTPPTPTSTFSDISGDESPAGEAD